MNIYLRILIFPFFYLKEIIVSSLRVAEDILFPNKYLDASLIEIDTSKLTSRQRFLLACLISMTPGTLSVAENADDNTITVHCLYGKEAKTIKAHLERNYGEVVQALPI